MSGEMNLEELGAILRHTTVTRVRDGDILFVRVAEGSADELDSIGRMIHEFLIAVGITKVRVIATLKEVELDIYRGEEDDAADSEG